MQPLGFLEGSHTPEGTLHACWGQWLQCGQSTWASFCRPAQPPPSRLLSGCVRGWMEIRIPSWASPCCAHYPVTGSFGVPCRTVCSARHSWHVGVYKTASKVLSVRAITQTLGTNTEWWFRVLFLITLQHVGQMIFCMGKCKHFCQWLRYLRLNSWKVSLLNWDQCFFVCYRLLLNALADALPRSIPGSHGICFPALRKWIAEGTFSTEVAPTETA